MFGEKTPISSNLMALEAVIVQAGFLRREIILLIAQLKDHPVTMMPIDSIRGKAIISRQRRYVIKMSFSRWRVFLKQLQP